MTEKIRYHLMWVWGQQEGFMKRGKEGMLIITTNRIVFVTQTKMKYKVHMDYSRRQLKKFEEGDYAFSAIDPYEVEDLDNDLRESDKNMNIPFSRVIDISQEKKRWGTTLKLVFRESNDVKTYKFMVVKGWVKYPLKDPVSFQHMNWNPIIAFSKDSGAQ
jgi:hypothetical protein